MLKLCYRDRDAAIRDYRRRVLIDRPAGPEVSDVMLEGIQAGSMHARYPLGVGRVLLLLACDVNDEVCDLLADRAGQPRPDDPGDGAVERLPGERGAALSGAPYGSIQLFDPGPLVDAWQGVMEELNRLEGKRHQALLASCDGLLLMLAWRCRPGRAPVDRGSRRRRRPDDSPGRPADPEPAWLAQGRSPTPVPGGWRG